MNSPPVLRDTSFPEPADTETRTRYIPLYHIILFNDDYHTIEWVVAVLCQALGQSLEKAVRHALEANDTGRAVVWSGSREVAELKLDQIRTFHEIREPDGVDLGPLECTIEPAPGA